MPWVAAGASTVGPSHVRRGVPGDDAHAYRVVGGIVILVVCDGAGSALRGREAARHLSVALVEVVSEWCADAVAEPDLGEVSDELVRGWFATLRASLVDLASAADAALAEHHSTVILVLATPQATIAAHIGDGVALRQADGQWSVLSWPEHGAYAGETVFLDDADLARDLRIARTAGSAAVAAASDGFDPFLIHHAQRRVLPHQLEPLRGAFLAGAADAAWDAQLAAYIANPVFDEHGDDDRTLVLAVWQGEPCPG